jgi:hypothetical protein
MSINTKRCSKHNSHWRQLAEEYYQVVEEEEQEDLKYEQEMMEMMGEILYDDYETRLELEINEEEEVDEGEYYYDFWDD